MSVVVPSELQDVPSQTLQGYVRQCARRTLDEYMRKLQSLPVSVKLSDTHTLNRCAGETLDDLFGKESNLASKRSSVISGQAPYKLVFTHDCKNVSCANQSCNICLNSQHRRCKTGNHFHPKYIKNDLLRARCDASVRIQLEDRKTGSLVYGDAVIKVTVIDASDYAKRLQTGLEADQAVDQAIRVYTNGKADGQPLLVTSTADYDDRKSIVLQMQNGVALLPDLRICESSEALRGRGAEFRLLVETPGMQDNGANIPVKYALSESFQVLSSRSKPNCKPAIPHVEDPVKNCEAIGDATVPKLERIKALAREMNIDLSMIPFSSITKVGEFRDLAILAHGDKNLQDKLRKVLSLTKDQWKMAYEHSCKAVVTDHRMRVWLPDPANTRYGVLFECTQGDVHLNSPIGILTPNGIKIESQLLNNPGERMAVKAEIEQLAPRAVADWYRDQHGNWGIYRSADEAVPSRQPSPLSTPSHSATMPQGFTALPPMEMNASAGPTEVPTAAVVMSMPTFNNIPNFVQAPYFGAPGATEFAGHDVNNVRAADPRPRRHAKMMRMHTDDRQYSGEYAAATATYQQSPQVNNGYGQQRPISPLVGKADAYVQERVMHVDGMHWNEQHGNVPEPMYAAASPEVPILRGAPLGDTGGEIGEVSAFENAGEAFQAMLQDILSQQVPSVEGENDMKRKPSRGLSELFTSMSLQQMAAADASLQSMPTGNMMDLLKSMMSEQQQANAGAPGPPGAPTGFPLFDNLSQQLDPTMLQNLLADEPATRTLLSQLCAQDGNLSNLTARTGGF